MRFFFYGSLLDPDIRRAVMGPGAARCRIAPAALAGWRRRRRKDAIYPILERRRGASVAGCVVDGIDARMAARLRAFEGQSYGVATLAVRRADGSADAALVFVPKRPVAGPAPWHFDEWCRGRKQRALRRAHAAMARAGRLAASRGMRPWLRRQRQWLN